MTEEIKPCPFCGGVYLYFEEGSTFRWLLACCVGCGAACGEVRVQTSGGGTKEDWLAQAKLDAIKAWNMRAIAQPVQPAVSDENELLKKEYCKIRGADTTHGLDCDSDYAEWLASRLDALAQPEQPKEASKSFAETYPAAKNPDCKCEHWQACPVCHPTYQKQSQPVQPHNLTKRRWKGLTKKEFAKCKDASLDTVDVWMNIEAKLKEKNA